MHVEPGFVAPLKVTIANAGAIGVLIWGFKEQLKSFAKGPWVLLKTLLAAVFFSIFMQLYSVPVGVSELHFVGAMAIYLTLGFTPALLGFAIGLGFQGLVFDPGDLYHLGVNSLSLMLPLITTHYVAGCKFFDTSIGKRLNWVNIVKLDAIYYAGVTTMVGFWLLIGDVQTPFADWASFAVSYLAIVALEPIVTYLAVRGLKLVEDNSLVARLTAVRHLTVA